MKLFVEGGGDVRDLQAACRRGFTDFITKAGIARRPRVIACGNRRNAFEQFCKAAREGEPAMLSAIAAADGPARIHVSRTGMQNKQHASTPGLHILHRRKKA